MELAERRANQSVRGAKSKGIELRRLTQEEILAEAAQTEIINRARSTRPHPPPYECAALTTTLKCAVHPKRSPSPP